MPIIEKFNFSQALLNQKLEQKENSTTKIDSRISDYFDYIYTYPPKIRIKWSTFDDLNRNDPLTKEKDFSFDDFANIENKAISNKYYGKVSQYADSYLYKVTSSRFFSKKTKKIQAELSNIPIYVILNGQREIVLSKPSNLLGSKNIEALFRQILYEQSGSFDQGTEKKQQLGLFFLSRTDAENYLHEIAELDIEGTQTVGLSLHCISLGCAYNITREFHPGLDFRFVPKLEEVRDLLENKISKAGTIIENEQHPLRSRKRDFSSLQKNGSFKGVPIYIVQLDQLPDNFDYVFFEKTQAENFIKQAKKNASLPKRGKTIKTKIFLYNLEDFLEDFEDRLENENSKEKSVPGAETPLSNNINLIAGRRYNFEKPYFITPPERLEELIGLTQNYKKNVIKDAGQSLNLKFRLLKRFVGVFFSVS